METYSGQMSRDEVYMRILKCLKAELLSQMLNKTSALNSVSQGLQLTEMEVLIKNFQTIEH